MQNLLILKKSPVGPFLVVRGEILAATYQVGPKEILVLCAAIVKHHSEHF
jgi:hypothetical protein